MNRHLLGVALLIPIHFIDVFKCETSCSASESTTASRIVEYGTAKYDFTGSVSDELSFAKGDKIEVTEVISDDWLRGKLGGHEGMFPRTFVELSQELGMIKISVKFDSAVLHS